MRIVVIPEGTFKPAPLKAKGEAPGLIPAIFYLRLRLCQDPSASQSARTLFAKEKSGLLRSGDIVQLWAELSSQGQGSNLGHFDFPGQAVHMKTPAHHNFS